MQSWAVVIPAKRLALAKTRMRPVTDGLGPAGHDALVLALLADTVAAAIDCAAVDRVLVVTDDPAASGVVRELGALVVPDEPDRGLNPALEHGFTAAGGTAVAALSSDLPALRPHELEAALRAAAGTPRCFVADGHGTGTTLLTALASPRTPASAWPPPRRTGPPAPGHWWVRGPAWSRTSTPRPIWKRRSSWGTGPWTSSFVQGLSCGTMSR